MTLACQQLEKLIHLCSEYERWSGSLKTASMGNRTVQEYMVKHEYYVRSEYKAKENSVLLSRDIEKICSHFKETLEQYNPL